MRQRVALLKVFGWGLLALLAACGPAKQPDARITLNAAGISLQLPPHWQAGLAGDYTLLSAHPLDAAGQAVPGAVFFIERDLSPSAPGVPALTAYAEARAASIQSLSQELRQLQQTDTLLDAQPAVSVLREYSDTTGSYRELAVMVVRGHLGYSFVGRTRPADFERLQPDIQSILDGVRWIPAK